MCYEFAYNVASPSTVVSKAWQIVTSNSSAKGVFVGKAGTHILPSYKPFILKVLYLNPNLYIVYNVGMTDSFPFHCNTHERKIRSVNRSIADC
jgi:hypothetical protein